ncbi:hypothetical protein [Arthrobacter rhombi]|uniref:hypothetical protein n=1 Tax=Arthrobacter rhombi TaxID=71253 RepID=UPI003FD4F51C
MCQLRSDGGRRCDDYERLKFCVSADFAPAAVQGVPDVAWKNDGLQGVWVDADDSRASACAALLVMEQIRAQEPKVTRSVMDVAAASGSECAHLEQRMKSPASLVRKVRTQQEEVATHGGDSSPARIAGSMKDVIRYTVVNPNHSRLGSVTVETVKGLREQGWDIHRIKNFYADGSAYKGIHVIGAAPSGVVCEVQIHSTHSLEVKNQNHVPYEVYRDKTAPKKARREARQECIKKSTDISNPEDLDLLTQYSSVSVSKS